MIRLNKYKNLDWYLIIAVVALSIFGIICIGSATHINLGESRSTYYSQIVWVSVGVIIMFIVANVNLEFFSNFYKYIYIFNIILLVAVLLIGTEANGATRWIYFGPVGIQPSEFSKIIIIFTLAKVIDKNRQRINNKIILVEVCLFVLIPILLIQKQPSLSASLVLFAILAVELFVAGLDYKYIGIALAIVVPIATYACVTTCSILLAAV